MAALTIFFAVIIVIFLFLRGRRLFTKGLQLYQERGRRAQKQGLLLLQGKMRSVKHSACKPYKVYTESTS